MSLIALANYQSADSQFEHWIVDRKSHFRFDTLIAVLWHHLGDLVIHLTGSRQIPADHAPPLVKYGLRTAQTHSRSFYSTQKHTLDQRLLSILTTHSFVHRD